MSRTRLRYHNREVASKLQGVNRLDAPCYARHSRGEAWAISDGDLHFRRKLWCRDRLGRFHYISLTASRRSSIRACICIGCDPVRPGDGRVFRNRRWSKTGLMCQCAESASTASLRWPAGERMSGTGLVAVPVRQPTMAKPPLERGASEKIFGPLTTVRLILGDCNARNTAKGRSVDVAPTGHGCHDCLLLTHSRPSGVAEGTSRRILLIARKPSSVGQCRSAEILLVRGRTCHVRHYGSILAAQPAS